MPAYRTINEAILTQADSLLFDENWDGEDAARPEPVAFVRAVLWLIGMTADLRALGAHFTPPLDINIGPCPDGSYDIDWLHRSGYELLINFKPDLEHAPTFYGDDGNNGDPIKRDPDGGASDGELLNWLARNFR